MATKEKPDVREMLGLQSMKDSEADGAGLSILVYGPAGHGKTRFCGTAPGVIVADCDLTGRATLRGFDVDVLPCTSLQNLRDLLDAYKSGILPAEDGTGRSLAIDPLTEVHLWIREEVSGGDKVTLEQWGRIQNRLSRLVREFRDLTAHGVSVIFTATTTMTKDEIEGGVIVRPEFFGAMSEAVPRLVDCVFYIAAKEEDSDVRRALITQPTGKYVAKVRTPKGVWFPLAIEPEFAAITDILAGGDPEKWSLVKREEG